MPYSQIISRAFEITRRHRALWVFGFLIALTGGASGNWGNGFNYSFNSGDSSRFEGFPRFDFDPGAVIGLIALVALVILVLAVVATIVRYVSSVALIDGVARADDGGVVTVAGGVRRGWSRDALYLFLNQLILNLPLVVLIIGAIVGAFMVLFGGIGAARASGRDGLAVAGIVGFLVLLLPIVGVAILLGIAIYLLAQWGSREIVLRGAGPIEAIGAAWRLARAHLKETILFGLLMWAIELGFGLLLMPLVLLAGAVVFGPAFLAYRASESLVPAVAVAVPLGLLALIAFSIVAGIFTTFSSTAWTLAWRHLRGVRPAAAPASSPLPGEGDAPALTSA